MANFTIPPSAEADFEEIWQYMLVYKMLNLLLPTREDAEI
jgi:hypothetical protein